MEVPRRIQTPRQRACYLNAHVDSTLAVYRGKVSSEEVGPCKAFTFLFFFFVPKFDSKLLIFISMFLITSEQ